MNRAAALGWLLCLLVAGGCASSGKLATAQISPAEMDEPALMEKLRLGAKSDPAAALALTEDGERRFGDSACAEERQAVAIQALIDLNRIGAARSNAYRFLERYPNGPYSAHVAAMTGVHLTPKGPAGHTSP
jgi:hypothetical protein